MVRAEDVFGRYGGDEFALAVRGIDLPGIAVLAERMRACVQEIFSAGTQAQPEGHD